MHASGADSVHPGAVYTGMASQYFESQEAMGKNFENVAPLKPHAGEPMDIAYAYLYLASDEAKFVTGEELVVDGGWTTN
jgi:NAD(P)-dependent dehydrogenase (short-subunit alcohol dehydrogenase family)